MLFLSGYCRSTTDRRWKKKKEHYLTEVIASQMQCFWDGTRRHGVLAAFSRRGQILWKSTCDPSASVSHACMCAFRFRKSTGQRCVVFEAQCISVLWVIAVWYQSTAGTQAYRHRRLDISVWTFERLDNFMWDRWLTSAAGAIYRTLPFVWNIGT